ncbi:MAG: BON domain-containing protein, partial [bacterium]|nr:BON domain-containing protein [bacterium]
MRRLLTGLVVGAMTAVVPTLALADNQETADQIAKNLRDSGQLHGYKIGVKVEDGTAWLKGQVRSQAQMNAALRLVFQTSGVTRIVNDLKVGSAEKSTAESQPSKAAHATVAAVKESGETARLATSTTLRMGEAKSAAAGSPRRATASRMLAASRGVELASHQADKQEKHPALV